MRTFYKALIAGTCYANRSQVTIIYDVLIVSNKLNLFTKLHGAAKQYTQNSVDYYAK